MEESAHNRLIGVIGLVVFALVAVGAVAIAWNRDDPPGTAFTSAGVSAGLRDATVDLIGYPPEGLVSLEDALSVAGRSVDDMSALDAAAFEETWERSAQAQAELVGRWLGLATSELDGADEVRVAQAAARLVERAPDESTDNPGIPGAESLRGAIRAGSAAADG